MAETSRVPPPRAVQGGSRKAEPSPWARWLTPALLAAVSLSWLLPRLTSESLHVDESRQIRPYTEGISASAGQLIEQGQPPIDAVIGSLFAQVLGANVFVARLPSVLWAAIAVAAVYLLARRWLGFVGSFLVALVLLVNPIFLFYSQYARPYAIALALFLGGLTLALRRTRAASAGAFVAIALLPWVRVVEGGSGAFIVALVLAWQWLTPESDSNSVHPARSNRGRVVAVTGLAVAGVSGVLGVFSVAGTDGGGYVAPDPTQMSRQTAVVMWELGRDFGLGVWLWLALCLAIVIAVWFASVGLRVLTAAVVALPVISILAIIVLAPIPVYERYQYFATPILCLVPLLVADITRTRGIRFASWIPGATAVGLIVIMLPTSWAVQTQVDFIPYAEIARTQQVLPDTYLVSSDYAIYEAADTAPEYQDVPSQPEFLPWITELLVADGPAPSHLALVAPIDVLDLRVRRDVRAEFPEGFRLVPLETNDAQGLLAASQTLPDGAAMKTALVALRMASVEGNQTVRSEARTWICELRARDPWPQAVTDSTRVLTETGMQPCDN